MVKKWFAFLENMQNSPVAENSPQIPDLTLELPMRFFMRTVHRTRQALETLQPGQVLALRTDDP